MIQDVKALPVSFYFSPDSPASYFIPKYQREYVWGWKDWDALFTDLEESAAGHFLGSFICVNAQTDGTAGGRLELIDGQQRFTTISLLFCALYRRLDSVENPDRKLMVELDNLENRIFVRSSGQWRLEPSEQASNKADFQKVLSDLFPKLVKAPKGLTYFGVRRIAKAYGYFCDRLTELNLEDTLALLDKLKAAMLVKIEVQSHSHAFMLFESINNRGIPLSAIDIIKNNLLAELDKRRDYGIDRAFDEWKDLIDLLPEPAVQERFLRQLYNMFKYLKWVEVKGCTRATRSNLITIYDTLLRRHPVRLFRALQDKAKTYATLLNPVMAEEVWGKDTAAALRDLQRLGAASAYAFLLWASQVSQNQGWNEGDTLRPLATFLTKWFFWRNLTDTPPTRELDPMFTLLVGELLNELREKGFPEPKDFVAHIETWLLARAPSEELCDMKLSADVYLENYEATRFMLCRLEDDHRTVEKGRDLWAQDGNNRPVFTVEHILPKTENLGTEWVKMLEAGQDDTANAIRMRCAHKLGNLTLSGYNSKLGTMDFLKKRERKNEKGDFIGYRNGLDLNRDVVSCETWNEATINARSDRMLKEVKAILGLRSQA